MSAFIILPGAAPLPGPATGGQHVPAGFRSPIDVAIVPGGKYALTANHTSHSVSLIELASGKVVAEESCGQKPSAVACSRDGAQVAVSNLWSGTVSLFQRREARLQPLGQVAVGPLPRGLVCAADGRSLYVAVAGADEIVRVDCANRTITWRTPAPREPRQLVLSPDGRWLAAASARSGQVRCWDTSNQQLIWERTIGDGFNLRGLAFTADGKSLICSHSVRRSLPVAKTNIEEGWVMDSRLTRLDLDPKAVPGMGQIAMDERSKAVGDPYGAALGGSGRWLAVTGSGTHELLLFEVKALPWNAGEPGDVLDPILTDRPGKFRRLPLGGRPLTVAFMATQDKVVIANYLQDALQVVDCETGKVVQTISLGPSVPPSLARKGEALFYDAQRSTHQWFSCNTCHVEGQPCGLNFDTLNDDSYGNPKLTPTLRNVTHTGPYTWHGWQKDLGAAVEKSLTQTMFGAKPTADQKQALLAFLETLDNPPNPHRGPAGKLSAGAERGEKLFRGKAGCIRCHRGPYYTSPGTYDVKLEPDDSPYDLWNPPSLLGLWDRGPYLHDGRSKTLEELLTEDHTPDKVGGENLTDAERKDLIAFLLSL